MPLEPSAVRRSPGRAQTNHQGHYISSRFQGGLTRTYAPLPDLSGIGADPSQLSEESCPSLPRVHNGGYNIGCSCVT
jgi:hypothetical protein